MSKHVLKVEEENSQLRLDVFLTNKLPNIPSRNFVKRLIDDGYVTLNESQVKAHHKVSVGDEVIVDMIDAQTDERPKAENIKLNIFYEDHNIIVINKPVGMLVHPVKSSDTGTLVNALLYHYKTLSDVNTDLRPGIVHRLDRETSGLIVVAKDNITHTKLAKQFAKHRVRKCYLALVEGDVEFDEGIVDVSLGKHEKFHDRMEVDFGEGAKGAKTQYRVLKRFKKYTRLVLLPKTGRTHQLRVHMAHLGHPILGDDKYGRKDSFPRLALHAQALGFAHPANKKYVEFSLMPPKEFLIA